MYTLRYESGAICGDYRNIESAKVAQATAQSLQGSDDRQAIGIVELDRWGDPLPMSIDLAADLAE